MNINLIVLKLYNYLFYHRIIISFFLFNLLVNSFNGFINLFINNSRAFIAGRKNVFFLGFLLLSREKVILTILKLGGRLKALLY